MNMKYCGYEVGTEISTEETERLFCLLHKCVSKEALLLLRQEELNDFARIHEGEWRNRR